MNATATRPQPQVNAQYVKLASGYMFGALDADGTDAYMLDLYGCKADEDDELEVFDAALAGTSISLCNLAKFSRADLMAMTDFCIEQRDEENADMKLHTAAPRRVWSGDMRIGQAA